VEAQKPIERLHQIFSAFEDEDETPEHNQDRNKKEERVNGTQSNQDW
jgi:hypothetical protein